MPEPSPQFFEPQPVVPGTPAGRSGQAGPAPVGPPPSEEPPHPDYFGADDAAALWRAAAAGPPDAGPARRMRASWGRLVRHRVWRSRGFRVGGLITLLAICGLVILALVRDETGTEGFLVGLGLAVLPLPLLIAVFRWLDRVDPGPWSNLFFAFAWGACAAALVAIIANSFATEAIALATADPSGAQSVGAIAIAPVVEESAKGTGVLLLFLFRRRAFTGVVDGIVFAGVTATGFAFTENILYLGKAFGEDQHTGRAAAVASFTAATFFMRIVLSPFAHPLFTTLTGAGFGLSAIAGGRVRRVLLPLGGLLLAMCMHALWNGASGAGGPYGFFVVYVVVMMPVFGLVTWLAVWARQRDLRAVGERLAAYVAAGWLVPAAPFALSSMRARSTARDLVARRYGSAAAAAVTEYERWATSLALLRRQAERGVPVPDFAEREGDLLGRMWQRGALAGPALTYAARATGRVRVPPPYVDYEGFNPYRQY